jgi:hypothetical protein
MQNSGLAASLALMYFQPAAAISRRYLQRLAQYFRIPAGQLLRA